MKSRKLGLGAPLAAIGAMGFVLGPALGLTSLGRPWTFVVGFTFGLMAGFGATLCVAGLAELRRPPASK